MKNLHVQRTAAIDVYGFVEKVEISQNKGKSTKESLAFVQNRSPMQRVYVQEVLV